MGGGGGLPFYLFPLLPIKNKAPERNGSFSDVDLAADCDVRADALATNLEALAEEGLTAAQVTKLRADTLAFRKLPNDARLSKVVSNAVVARDAALEAARSGLRRAYQPVRRAYGDESPESHSFEVGEVSRKSIAQVLNLLLTVPAVGEPYITDPRAIAEGFTEARLTALGPLYDALFAKEGTVTRAETAAEQGTRTRVLAYNALNTLCSALCARGYDHFVEINEQKAQLFVRHPASHGGGQNPGPTPAVG